MITPVNAKAEKMSSPRLTHHRASSDRSVWGQAIGSSATGRELKQEHKNNSNALPQFSSLLPILPLLFTFLAFSGGHDERPPLPYTDPSTAAASSTIFTFGNPRLRISAASVMAVVFRLSETTRILLGRKTMRLTHSRQGDRFPTRHRDRQRLSCPDRNSQGASRNARPLCVDMPGSLRRRGQPNQKS